MLVYNSSRCGTSKCQQTCGFTTNLLVYSPSVSAGVSFTEPFWFFGCVSSELAMHSSVDLSLQQLFRGGVWTRMHIHVRNKQPNVKLPHTLKHRAMWAKTSWRSRHLLCSMRLRCRWTPYQRTHFIKEIGWATKCFWVSSNAQQISRFFYRLAVLHSKKITPLI
jgi:hypothetical protein